MAGYQGMSFENQRMIRDAMDFVKKRKIKQDELEQQRIEAARLAAVAGPNAELKRTEMLIDAEKDKDYQARDQAWNRKNDAFETSKGRMSPDLFNMKWGGGADDGGGRRRGGGNGMVELGGGANSAFNSRLEAAKLATTKPMVDGEGNVIPGGFNKADATSIQGFMDAGATGQQDYQTMARERALEDQFAGGGSADVQQGTRKDGTRFWGNMGSDFNNGTALQSVGNPQGAASGQSVPPGAIQSSRRPISNPLDMRKSLTHGQPTGSNGTPPQQPQGQQIPDMVAARKLSDKINRQIPVPTTTAIGRSIKSGTGNYLNMLNDSFNNRLNGGVSTLTPPRKSNSLNTDDEMYNAFQSIRQPPAGTKKPKFIKDKPAIRQWQHDNMPPWYLR